VRFLVIGLGSMGKRRIRNLLYLGEKDVFGYDLREDRCLEAYERYGVRAINNFKDALAREPDVYIISTPPKNHLEYALKAAENDKHFFCEAPLSTSLKGLDELIRLSERGGRVAAPSCNMCFNPGIRLIRDIVRGGRLAEALCLIYEFGHYLPEWHPYEDYRTYYVAHSEQLGGGWDVFPMELVWLLWLFGDVETIACVARKLTRLEIDVEDAQNIILEFRNKMLTNLHFDVIQRAWTGRYLKLVGEKGTAIWNSEEKKVRLFTVEKGEWEVIPEPDEIPYEVKGIRYSIPIAEGMYVKEMEHFLKAIRGEERYMVDLRVGRRVVEVLEAARESSKIGRHVSL